MKTRNEILAHLQAVMVETFELDPADLTEDADLRETLGLDSIDAVDMAVKIQEYTGKKPSFVELAQLSTLGDVVGLIQSHLRKSSEVNLPNEHASTGS
jgi:acyl carrier protein